MQRQVGFTLLELLITLTITATLATAGARALATMAASVRLASSARALAQSLRETRAAALAEGRPLEVLFDAAAGTWVERDLAGIVRRVSTLPGSVSYGPLPAQPRVRFGTTGTAENRTITLVASASSRQIVVNQRGRVRLT